MPRSLNLTFATRALTRLREDTCRITHYVERPQISDGALFDFTTGEYTTTPATTIIYEGKCLLWPQLTSQPRAITEGEVDTYSRFYNLGVPLSVVDAEVGDMVEILATKRDGIVGRTYFIRDILSETLAIHRRMVLEHRERAS